MGHLVFRPLPQKYWHSSWRLTVVARHLCGILLVLEQLARGRGGSSLGYLQRLLRAGVQSIRHMMLLG